MAGRRAVVSIDAGQSILGELELGATAQRQSDAERNEAMKGYNIGKAIARLDRRGEVFVCFRACVRAYVVFVRMTESQPSVFRGTKSCLKRRMCGRAMTMSRCILGISIKCERNW